MVTKDKTFSLFPESGNVMIYVLIVVALFGLLSFVLARQSGTSESGSLNSERAEIYASTIQQASMQMKQSIDQMIWTGSTISFTSAGTQIDFITPDDPNFDVGSPTHKLFHPKGGGLILPRLPDDALDEVSSTPAARWYIGRFNNVEWTPSSEEDVILTAHQIKREVCERINYKLTGSTAIPETFAGDQVNELLIDGSESSPSVSNIEFTSASCAACYGMPSLCVKDSGVNAWSFYSIVGAQ